MRCVGVLAEADLTISGIDADGGALRVLAGEYCHAEGVEQVVLDGAFEGAGTVYGVVAVGGHQLCCGIAELHFGPAFHMLMFCYACKIEQGPRWNN